MEIYTRGFQEDRRVAIKLTFAEKSNLLITMQFIGISRQQ
jgi:hypothetical protein